jgi:hypothetical protein
MAKSSKRKYISPKSIVQENNITPESAEPAVVKRKEALSSGWPVILGWAAMLVFTFHASTHMVAAGDTWVAMACGRHFLSHGVDTVEPFSANSHKAGPTPETMKAYARIIDREADDMALKGQGNGIKYSVMRWWAKKCANFENWSKWKQSFTKWIHPTGWINQNWLAQVLFYKMVPESSYADGVSFTSNALVYWKFAIYILAVICVYYTSRLLGANPAIAAIFSCFAMFIGRSFLDVRPAGFSNLFVAMFLLILVLSTYRNVLYIWLIVPLTVFWCNVHGGYIYVFIMMIPFIGIHLFTCLNKKWTAILYNVIAWPFLIFVLSKAGLTIASFLFFVLVIILDIILVFFKDNLVSIGRKGVYHSIGAFFAAFFASLLLNPFHLTNFTHTFVISVSKNAERWRDVHEWHPAFDWSNPVGTAVPFLVMYIIIWLVFIIWLLAVISISDSDSQSQRQKRKDSTNFQLPRINIASIIIVALTIYMAVRSRRFIPIAGIAGCPIIAMFITQLIHALSAKKNFSLRRSMAVPEMPRSIQQGFVTAGAVFVIFFATWWGYKFKVVYLDPWPNDSKFSSVFMRMTASDAKPFYAMKFIRDNKLRGKMFNYWTEGGFIAWGQDPDPNGHTPLQLFMDGRAQAAYNVQTFNDWSYILAGGKITYEILQRANARNGEPTEEDYKQIGEFMDKELRDWNVWVYLMPASIYNDPDKTSSYYTFRALEAHPSWRLVFVNDREKLLVDIRTQQGKKLYDGILTGETKYPDEYHKNLMSAYKLLLYEPTLNDKKQGLEYAMKAFEEQQSPAAMWEIIADAARYTELMSFVREYCKVYSDNFEKSKEDFIKIDGYRLKVESARLANYYLARIEGAQGNNDLVDLYNKRRDYCLNELRRIGLEKRW